MIKRSLLACAALASGAVCAGVQYAEAPVIDVEPIVETVQLVEPKEECWFERVPARDGEASAHAPLLGALIGGAVGNAVGRKKRNKQVGAVVGALLGGSIGHEIRRESGRNRSTRRVHREICEVVEETR